MRQYGYLLWRAWQGSTSTSKNSYERSNGKTPIRITGSHVVPGLFPEHREKIIWNLYVVWNVFIGNRAGFRNERPLVCSWIASFCWMSVLIELKNCFHNAWSYGGWNWPELLLGWWFWRQWPLLCSLPSEGGPPSAARDFSSESAWRTSLQADRRCGTEHPTSLLSVFCESIQPINFVFTLAKASTVSKLVFNFSTAECLCHAEWAMSAVLVFDAIRNLLHWMRTCTITGCGSGKTKLLYSWLRA